MAWSVGGGFWDPTGSDYTLQAAGGDAYALVIWSPDPIAEAPVPGDPVRSDAGNALLQEGLLVADFGGIPTSGGLGAGDIIGPLPDFVPTGYVFVRVFQSSNPVAVSAATCIWYYDAPVELVQSLAPPPPLPTPQLYEVNVDSHPSGYGDSFDQYTGPPPGVDHFDWEPIGPTQLVGVPFEVTITARLACGWTGPDPSDTVDIDFTNTVMLSGLTPSNAPVVISPTTSSPFTNGVWTGMITVHEPVSNMVLRAEDGGGRTGESEGLDTLSSIVLNTNDSGPGSLRQVVSAASDGDIITFSSTLSSQTIILTSGQIFVSNSLSIDADSLTNGIAIDGNNSSRIFEFAAGTTNMLTSLTLTNGLVSGGGYDGAGGAILLHSGAVLTVTHTTLSGNAAAIGGGIYNDSGTLLVTDAVVSGNAASSDGAGIYNRGELALARSTLAGNDAGIDGGGIHNGSGVLALTNSTFFGNSAGGDGGGVFSSAGTVTIGNATFVDNLAGAEGGGIYCPSHLTVANSIVADNWAYLYPNVRGSITGSHNLMDVDPMLAPLGLYGGSTPTMPPLPGSPAIDAGDNAVTNNLSTDQRGYPRPVNDIVDIGAVEIQGVSDWTLAWWRFEAGPDGTDVVHANPVGVFSPDVPDSSGHGNHLSVWSTGAESGYGYRSDVPAGQIPFSGATNHFSVQNTGGYPCLFTSSNAPIHTITPLAWTIEVAFQPENTGTHRTLVGRDSRGTATANTNLAALYLQITPADELAVVFCDVSGVWHQAVSGSGMVHGFTYPHTSTGQWQTAVATCDGDTLRLYYQNLESGAGALTLVAETDLTLSGSPDRRLTAGAGSGSDWTHGTWSVGRGLFAGGHVDRAWGFIDEVRISVGALAPDAFLFPPPTPVVTLAHRYSFNKPQGSSKVEPDLVGSADGAVRGTSDYTGVGQLLLDGAIGSYVDLPNGIISTLSNATFEAWVTHTSTLDWERIFDFGTSTDGEDISGTGDSYLFLTPASGDTNVSNAFRLAVRSSITNGESPILNGPGPLPLGVEMHVVVSYDETLGVVNLYTNGVLVSSGRLTVPLGSINDVNNWLGRSQWNDPYFTGLFNEFRIYAGAMNDSQVAASYAAGPDADIMVPLIVLNTNDAGPGSLRQVVAYAGPSDAVTFNGTLSGQTITLTSGQILVTNNLTINASSLPGGIIVDGNTNSRIFEFASNTVNFLFDLTLTNGLAAGSTYPDNAGGAILVNSNAMLATFGSTFTSNSAEYGGAIANHSGTLYLFVSSVSFNHATHRGGSIYNDNGALTIEASELSGNSASEWGGGIENHYGMLTLNNSTLSSNSSILEGGGINNHFGTIVSSNSMFTGNSSDTRGGGGIQNYYGTLILNNTTLSDNAAHDHGGAIQSDHGTNTLDTCTLSSNSATNYGGAIENFYSTLILNNSVVASNTATWGGGVDNNTGVVTITHSTFAGNSSNPRGGGGIHNYQGEVSLYESFFSGNHAFASGGGIHNDHGILMVQRSTFAYNIADDWGGGINNNGFLVLTSSTLVHNSAGLGGGAIVHNTNNLLTLIHATVTDNSAIEGGGIDNTRGGDLYLTNTIVAGNSASSYPDIDGPALGANNLTNGVPILAPLGDYGGPTQTMPPLPSSPAIDAGTNLVSLPATDQRGFARVFNGIVDIGAVEFQGTTDVGLFWATDWDGDGSPFGVELALGTDPLVADSEAPGYPVPYPPDTGNGISFGFNSAATNYTAWVVRRSLDLSLPDSFVEIYRYDGPTGITTATNDLNVNVTGDSIEITDELMPQPPSAFYQVTIEPSP